MLSAAIVLGVVGAVSFSPFCIAAGCIQLVSLVYCHHGHIVQLTITVKHETNLGQDYAYFNCQTIMWMTQQV